MAFLKEFISFLFARKKFWLFPVLIMLGLVGFIIVFAEGSAISPFIYTLF